MGLDSRVGTGVGKSLLRALLGLYGGKGIPSLWHERIKCVWITFKVHLTSQSFKHSEPTCDSKFFYGSNLSSKLSSTLQSL